MNSSAFLLTLAFRFFSGVFSIKVDISLKNFFLSAKLVPAGIKYPTPIRFSQL